MDWLRRRAGSLLGLGLIGGLVWTAVVTLSQPSGFDPGESCARKLAVVDGVARTSWFPPSASCVSSDGEVHQYMSTTKSVVLSVIGVPLLICLVIGLVLFVRRLTGEPGPARTADGVDLRRRQRSHLLFGAIDLAVAYALITFLNAMAIVFGGLPGAFLIIVATLTGLSALCTILDGHMGPLPSTPLESRRRGTVAGVGTYAVVFAATSLSGQLPFFRLWAIPLGGIAYAVIVAVQWSRATNTATRVQYFR